MSDIGGGGYSAGSGGYGTEKSKKEPEITEETVAKVFDVLGIGPELISLAQGIEPESPDEPAEEKPSPAEEKPSPAEEKPSPAEEKPSPAEEKPSPAEESKEYKSESNEMGLPGEMSFEKKEFVANIVDPIYSEDVRESEKGTKILINLMKTWAHLSRMRFKSTEVAKINWIYNNVTIDDLDKIIAAEFDETHRNKIDDIAKEFLLLGGLMDKFVMGVPKYLEEPINQYVSNQKKLGNPVSPEDLKFKKRYLAFHSMLQNMKDEIYGDDEKLENTQNIKALATQLDKMGLLDPDMKQMINDIVDIYEFSEPANLENATFKPKIKTKKPSPEKKESASEKKESVSEAVFKISKDDYPRVKDNIEFISDEPELKKLYIEIKDMIKNSEYVDYFVKDYITRVMTPPTKDQTMKAAYLDSKIKIEDKIHDCVIKLYSEYLNIEGISPKTELSKDNLKSNDLIKFPIDRVYKLFAAPKTTLPLALDNFKYSNQKYEFSDKYFMSETDERFLTKAEYEEKRSERVNKFSDLINYFLNNIFYDAFDEKKDIKTGAGTSPTTSVTSSGIVTSAPRRSISSAGRVDVASETAYKPRTFLTPAPAESPAYEKTPPSPPTYAARAPSRAPVPGGVRGGLKKKATGTVERVAGTGVDVGSRGAGRDTSPPPRGRSFISDVPRGLGDLSGIPDETLVRLNVKDAFTKVGKSVAGRLDVRNTEADNLKILKFELDKEIMRRRTDLVTKENEFKREALDASRYLKKSDNPNKLLGTYVSEMTPPPSNVLSRETYDYLTKKVEIELEDEREKINDVIATLIWDRFNDGSKCFKMIQEARKQMASIDLGGGAFDNTVSLPVTTISGVASIKDRDEYKRIKEMIELIEKTVIKFKSKDEESPNYYYNSLSTDDKKLYEKYLSMVPNKELEFGKTLINNVREVFEYFSNFPKPGSLSPDVVMSSIRTRREDEPHFAKYVTISEEVDEFTINMGIIRDELYNYFNTITRLDPTEYFTMKGIKMTPPMRSVMGFVDVKVLKEGLEKVVNLEGAKKDLSELPKKVTFTGDPRSPVGIPNERTIELNIAREVISNLEELKKRDLRTILSNIAPPPASAAAS